MKTLENMTDEELAMLYIDGNNRAFDLLLSRNQSRLFSYILFVVRDRNTAEDIFQETFVKVITRLQDGKYTTSGKFSAWIMRIAHNVMLDMYRDNRLQNIVETPDDNDMSKIRDEYVVFDNAENTIVRGQVMSDVKKMVNLLPPTQREVVYMRYYQQLSFKEIAELTNVSINTSLGRMRYALLNLRRMAKEHDVFSNITMF